MEDWEALGKLRDSVKWTLRLGRRNPKRVKLRDHLFLLRDPPNGTGREHRLGDVRYWSLVDISAGIRDVRFTPLSGHAHS